MASTNTSKSKRREVYFVRSREGGYEIGPFRTKEGALAEARSLKADGDQTVRIRTENVSEASLTPGAKPKRRTTGEGGSKGSSGKPDPDAEFFDPDDDDDDDDFEKKLEALFADDDGEEVDDEEEDDDDEEEEEDEAPKVTHGFFRKLGKDD